MSLEQLYIDHGVEIAPEDHKHSRDGWINVVCPNCTDVASEGFHLGFNTNNSYFSCYHCGGLPIIKTISSLLSIRYDQAKDLIKKYDIKNSKVRRKKNFAKVNLHSFKLPSNTDIMNKAHRRYLKSRGFDPEYLEKEFGLLGTGPFSKLDKTEYKFRIIAPILWDGNTVSFQSRDYTEKQELRYLTCARNRELIHHKHILYGKNPMPYTRVKRGIIVEGITDVWRFGSMSYATFGIGYTIEQVNVIRKMFEEVVIIFDEEKRAQVKARKLYIDLLSRGVKVSNVVLNLDPGSLSQKKADKLLCKLKFI